MPGLLELGVVSCFLHMKSFPAQHLHTNHTYGSPGAQLVMLPWTKLTNACSKIDMSGSEPGSHAFVRQPLGCLKFCCPCICRWSTPQCERRSQLTSLLQAEDQQAFRMVSRHNLAQPQIPTKMLVNADMACKGQRQHLPWLPKSVLYVLGLKRHGGLTGCWVEMYIWLRAAHCIQPPV